MSLRDQLLAKGLVSKKRAREIDRQARDERKAEQGARKRLKDLEREARERGEAEARAEHERRLAERREREASREVAERALRVRNLLAGNRLRPGRGQRFWHRSPDGLRLQEIEVSSGMAYQLRAGEVALAAFDHGTWSEVLPIPARAAEKLEALAPELILFWVKDTSGLSDPALRFHARDWAPDLRARRVKG